MVVGIGTLYFGADWLVRGSARLATSLGISPLVVGLTVVAFGTSAPELVACAVAVWDGKPLIAIGNVFGSNLANVGLILGLTSIMVPVKVNRRVVRRDGLVMILVTLAIFPMVYWDSDPLLGRLDGAILLVALLGYLGYTLRAGDDETEIVGEVKEMVESQPSDRGVHLRNVALVLLGAFGLFVGGLSVVEGASNVAAALGVSDVVIGLTLVAVGTSLPELATALVAAARKELSIALGNVVGSNIFNVAVLGMVSIGLPIEFPKELLVRELAAVLLMSLLLLGMMRHRWSIGRWEGFGLLATYLVLVLLILRPV